MKVYAETIFDIIYLLIVIIIGIIILKKQNDDVENIIGKSILILGIGDAFHLIPRIISYFSRMNFSMYLGIGKLITSITITIFYFYLYKIYKELINTQKNKKLNFIIYVLILIRIALCLLPQNKWEINKSPFYMSIVRNVPFVILGAIIIYLYFKDRNVNKNLKNIWIYVLFSFIFYVPVAFFSSIYPILGILMIPKTICYILIVYTFYRLISKNIR